MDGAANARLVDSSKRENSLGICDGIYWNPTLKHQTSSYFLFNSVGHPLWLLPSGPTLQFHIDLLRSSSSSFHSLLPTGTLCASKTFSSIKWTIKRAYLRSISFVPNFFLYTHFLRGGGRLGNCWEFWSMTLENDLLTNRNEAQHNNNTTSVTKIYANNGTAVEIHIAGKMSSGYLRFIV